MYVNLQDWLAALAGGGLIGLAAALLLLGNGRIAGISGILGRAMARSANPFRRDDLAFLAGLIGTPVVLALLFGAPQIEITTGPVVLAIGGLAVGLGTALGNGCTSGHGVCGLSRLSFRSIVATGAFMTAGIATATVLRPMFGL